MSKRFRHAVVHIGLGKTGSTSIQYMLHQRAATLDRDHDFHYPVDFVDPRPFLGNHSLYLRSICAERPHLLRFNKVAGLADREYALEADAKLRIQFETGFSRSTATRLLLSAESVGHFDEQSTVRLYEWLTTYCDQVQIIAAVRHPLHALAGEIQQRLKSGARLESLLDRPPFYRYSEVFSRLETNFGRDAISLYDYAAACVPGNSVLTRFLHALGLPRSLSFGLEEVRNAGMSREATLLLGALNRQRPLLIDGHMNPERSPGDLSSFIEVRGSAYVPPARTCRRLLEMSSGELAWLERHYQLSLDPMGFEIPASDMPVDGAVQAEIDALAIALSDQFNAASRQR